MVPTACPITNKGDQHLTTEVHAHATCTRRTSAVSMTVEHQSEADQHQAAAPAGLRAPAAGSAVSAADWGMSSRAPRGSSASLLTRFAPPPSARPVTLTCDRLLMAFEEMHRHLHHCALA